ncbi:chitin synthase chs-1-like [Alosa sapidissima]|uniref:chitin synthase chs-1-like n=1 Tax=Alosa sapidissima TaxID=34773 RepID=UPI001C0A4540|nr:chitin synthase chs-1-like [Alosa sapidissima]
MLCIPSGYLLLAIYSMVNMNNVSWGTRESAGPKPAASAAAASTQEHVERSVKFERRCKCCRWNLGLQVGEDQEETEVLPVGAQQTEPVSASHQEPEEKKSHREDPGSHWIARLVKKSRKLKLERHYLDKDEVQFWEGLQEHYLKPLDEDMARKKKIEADLKDLRNKATFVYFVCNALWLVATFFLQEIGGAVSIRIPKIYTNGTIDPNGQIFFDPIGLMFVIGFALILLI